MLNEEKITLLFSDGEAVVALKPAGVVSEDVAGGFPEMLRNELGGEIFPVHRLDRGTAGLMVYARSAASASSLSRQIADGSVIKEYLAVVSGRPERESGEFCDLLYFDRRRNKSFVVTRGRKGVKEARLSYRLLSEKEGKSLLRIRLFTGRTHQIRVQLSSRGMPLEGDRAYGGSKGKYPALFCCRLEFSHPVTGEKMSFEAAPDDLRFADFIPTE